MSRIRATAGPGALRSSLDQRQTYYRSRFDSACEDALWTIRAVRLAVARGDDANLTTLVEKFGAVLFHGHRALAMREVAAEDDAGGGV